MKIIPNNKKSPPPGIKGILYKKVHDLHSPKIFPTKTFATKNDRKRLAYLSMALADNCVCYTRLLHSA